MNIISGIGESGFLAHSAFSAGIATKDSNGNDITATYLTGVDLTPYQTIEGMTAYQEAGDYLTTADSGSFLTAVPDTYLQNTDLEISDNKITGISGIPLAAGGGVTGDFELSAGSGISIVDYPLEQKTVISVTAQGGNPEVEQAVIDNSATWDSVTAKQDALNFGYHDTAISSIDNSTLYDNSAHARITTLAGRISDLSSNKLDTTAFSDVSGTFLTAHQDISNKLDTTAFSDVSGSFLTAVPDTYLQNTDLSTEDGKVTAISGIPLSAGGDVPEGVMVESGLEYNAVQEISGYNGSAIAQYGAEKQFIVHDDTLVHLSNSAQYALGVQVPNVAKLMGVDETVLWTGARQTTGTIQLSESMWNYNEMDIYVCPDYNTYSTHMGYQITRLTVIPQTDSNEQLLCYAKSNRIASNTYLSELFYLRFNPDGDSVDFSPGIKWSNNTVTTGVTAFTGAVTKIVGIGRKH